MAEYVQRPERMSAAFLSLPNDSVSRGQIDGTANEALDEIGAALTMLAKVTSATRARLAARQTRKSVRRREVSPGSRPSALAGALLAANAVPTHGLARAATAWHEHGWRGDETPASAALQGTARDGRHGGVT